MKVHEKMKSRKRHSLDKPSKVKHRQERANKRKRQSHEFAAMGIC